MPQTSICRMCLVTDVRMFTIAGTPLQAMYEKITEAELLENMKPVAACYICHAQLRRSLDFMLRAVKADEALTDFLINNKLTVKSVGRIDRTLYKLHHSFTTKVEIHDNTMTEADDEPKVKKETSFEFVADDHVDYEDHSDFLPLNEPDVQIDEKTVIVQPEPGFVEVEFMKEEKDSPISDGDDNRDVDSEDERPLTKIKAVKRKHEDSEWKPPKKQPGEKKSLKKARAQKRETDLPTNNEEKPYRCIHCPATFSRDYHLKRHVQTHTGEKPHQCTYCDASFIQLYHLKRHLTTHTGEAKFSCNFCQRKFKRDDNLRSHLRTHGQYAIPKAEWKSVKKRETDHDDIKPKVDNELPPNMCVYCNQVFDNDSDLTDHMESHVGEIKFDVSNKNIKAEKGSCPKDICVSKPFLCNQCGARFGRRYHLDRHLRAHSKQKPVECEFCSIIFNDKNDLRKHLKTHDSEIKYECDLCQRKFTIKKNLENHLAKHAEGITDDNVEGKKSTKDNESVVCNVCGVILNRKSSLKIHMVRHTGEKPFECNICHNKFTQKGSMTSHMKKHTGEKPYECSICHWKFYGKGNLNTHMTKHSDEKPHECNFCHRKFKRKDVFKMHLRLHTGETPYECYICLRKFALKKTMKRHVAKHKEKGPQIPHV